MYGYWTTALYSIEIDAFESFLKQQKKEAKNASKHSHEKVTHAAAASADTEDADEAVPDVDPAHEQLNLPANSVTLWKIIPKLDNASQVKIKDCCFIS